MENMSEESAGEGETSQVQQKKLCMSIWLPCCCCSYSFRGCFNCCCCLILVVIVVIIVVLFVVVVCLIYQLVVFDERGIL